MPEYRRAFAPGGTFFFTAVTEGRAPILCEENSRRLLRAAFEECRARFPFEVNAIVLLPDHLHPIWTLPDGDADFSTRWSILKRRFTQTYLEGGGDAQPVSDSRRRNRRCGVWQRRFWEHLVRDQSDYNRHLDYVHYNPVKHGLVQCPHQWPYSSFHRWVELGVYSIDWQCVCGGKKVTPPDFDGLNLDGIE